MYLDLNPMPVVWVVLAFAALALFIGAMFVLQDTLYDLLSARGIVGILTAGAAMASMVVAMIFTTQLTDQNAVRVQAAVKQTYGIELSTENAKDLLVNNLNPTPGLTDVAVKVEHDARTNTDTITYQQAELVAEGSGRTALVMVGSPYTQRYPATTEFALAN